MAWTASLDKRFNIEGADLVAYVTYTDGKQTDAGVRTPGESEKDILIFIARECQRRADVDARVAALNVALASITTLPGPIALPDISAQVAFDAANTTLFQKLSAAQSQKQITDLTPIDPTIPAAVAAQTAAALAVKS